MSDTVAAAAPSGTIPVGVEVLEQFHSQGQQRHAAQLGMWLWLATELLLFAGLFVIAFILHLTHPESVRAATLHLKFGIGATNTAVLICSSLTMSGAIITSRLGWQRLTVRCLLATAALGTLFLMLKSFEYYQDYVENMMPFLFRPYALEGDPASKLFTNLYFMATGLHAFHLTTGVAILLWMAWEANKAGFLQRHQNRIEIYGLYWHFIDLIWIMVFTIIYTVGR